MRMFLVGMCDIFLLLYVTSLASIEEKERNSKRLTVEDYYELKEVRDQLAKAKVRTEDELKEILDEAQAERKRAALALEAEIKAREAQAEALRLATERERLAKEALEREVEARRDRAEALSAAEKAALESERLAAAKEKSEEERAYALSLAQQREELAAEALRRETEALRRERTALKQSVLAKLTLEAVESKQEELSQELESREVRIDELIKAVEQTKLNEAQAKALAEKERKEKEVAAKQAADAALNAKSARAAARVARIEAVRAKQEAEQAKEVAQIRAKAAVIAKQEAFAAKAEASQSKTELEAVTQPSDIAVRQNVKAKLVDIRADVRRKVFLLGSRKDVLNLAGIPVRFGTRTVIFVPSEQLGLVEGSSAEDFLDFRVTVNGSPVHSLLVNRYHPSLIGLAIDNPLTTAEPISESEVSGYMPTLIAMRNKSDMKFFDRIRELNSEYFVFKRDLLKRISFNLYRYGAQGIRGTGDYGEHILKGDQVLDLKGQFIGVAIADNRVVTIPSLANWSEVDARTTSAADMFRKVLRLLGKKEFADSSGSSVVERKVG